MVISSVFDECSLSAFGAPQIKMIGYYNACMYTVIFLVNVSQTEKNAVVKLCHIFAIKQQS